MASAAVSEMFIISLLLGMVATMFGLLTMVVGWFGNRMIAKMDEMHSTVHNIEADIHSKLGQLDKRVTVVETVMRSVHPLVSKQAEAAFRREDY
jgi:hypothetical protein